MTDSPVIDLTQAPSPLRPKKRKTTADDLGRSPSLNDSMWTMVVWMDNDMYETLMLPPGTLKVEDEDNLEEFSKFITRDVDVDIPHAFNERQHVLGAIFDKYSDHKIEYPCYVYKPHRTFIVY